MKANTTIRHSLVRTLLATTILSLTASGCYAGADEMSSEGEADDLGDVEGNNDDASPETEKDPLAKTTCGPQMNVYPVAEAHNTGYDASCNSGTCEVSCPDIHANSDWGGDHHGIDIFARRGAPLVAVADGVIEAVGDVSETSGLRVRMRDACGWEYYYGHLEEAFVRPGDKVIAGQLIASMGSSGANSVHLHFNVSFDGNYSNDIDPIDLLRSTSPTACGADSAPLPRVVYHNVQTPVRFAHNGESCQFTFMHGNYGVGYATIMATGGACGLVRSSVTTATDTAFYTATSETRTPGEWAQATAEAGLILGSDYCVELFSGGSLAFGYNALANTIEDEAVRDHGCL